jgi:hypothetical protein
MGLGLGLIVAFYTVTGHPMLNQISGVVAGIVLMALGLCSVASRKNWQSWVVAGIGAWMIVAGSSFPSAYVANTANDILAGAVIVFVCTWEVFFVATRS